MSATPLGDPQVLTDARLYEPVAYLDKLNDADQLADLVSCALLPGSAERQTILETVEVEPRLKHLIHFLMAEIKQHRKNRSGN